MSGWFNGWFGKGNATDMKLEETDDKLVYDQATQRWIKESELKKASSSGTPSPLPTTTSPLPPSSPLPTATPPVGVCQPTTPGAGRRPRYVDPFTQQVHHTAPPVVEVSTTPVV
ncbi:hypothetical protein EIN_403130 [Entamoeba invadens IP1]|uniref:Uncharacterized protein n=1 Tax=Entamoeba invadens IP1 TaxID=370355 RepID=A0A0A1UCI3_ENTIV|nr:hypothetical protein EIN_403130 [Entamoeba invadens IP1]ELP89999.1 hypothetical protein EIN_403130 [Entamoeba invadens IP1]|eukprot:XP_004256770.1 hypothetical protein EIN_403130 [Entamoeba invadens IP1]